LLRAPGLAAFRARLVASAAGLDPDRAADTFVVVPTHAAGEQLRRTMEDRLLETSAAIVLPRIGTRADLHESLASRLRRLPRVLSGIEREVILAAAARDAEEAGLPSPFHVRPALVAEMLSLYDDIRRLQRSIDDFDRLLSGELTAAAEDDRGAAQLLEQTRFLVAAYRGYESRLVECGVMDEHLVRAALVEETATRPLRHVVIAVGDRVSDQNGLWPADAAMLTSIDGLGQIDIVATDAQLDAGYFERLQLAFVGLEIEPPTPGSRLPTPVLVDPVLSYRDREDELEGVARRLKSPNRSTPLHRHALVVARPLPYLYLARSVFGGAGIPFESLDTLPLAAEPYAAALDLVLDFVSSGFTRASMTALLRSPHFVFMVDGRELAKSEVRNADLELAELRYLGGLDRLAALAERTELPALRVALDIARALTPLTESRLLPDQLQTLTEFLVEHDRPGPPGTRHEARGTPRDRRSRVRAAVIASLAGLAAAYRRHDPGSSFTIHDLTPLIRRWLGGQTFATRIGEPGLQIIDAHAAKFGEFDDVQLMGLVDGDWPERPRRHVLYPQSLLAQLEPERPRPVDVHREREALAAARADFRDLMGLARSRTILSTLALESDAVVEPSVLLDEVKPDEIKSGVRSRESGVDWHARVFAHEALALDPPRPDVLAAGPAEWARLRLAPRDGDESRFQGEAGEWTLPRVSVSRLEQYLKCPFQFYATNVLKLDEEPEDEVTRSPLERGQFLHEIFETFFHEWQQRGHARITPDRIDEARALFAEVCEPALGSLSPAEAGLERARLFGSAVAPGIADRVFAMEAERPVEIRRRFMEYELEGEFAFANKDGKKRGVRLRAKIDRVDLLADGTFRLIDYKTKYVMDRKLALQLPIYSACVRERLSAQEGRAVPVGEAMYLSFEGPRGIVPLEARDQTIDELIEDAEDRLVTALDDIAAGHFPPRPHQKSLCTMCAFVAVCRHAGGIEDGSRESGVDSRESGVGSRHD
jgi:RecB family exonuclease